MVQPQYSDRLAINILSHSLQESFRFCLRNRRFNRFMARFDYHLKLPLLFFNANDCVSLFRFFRLISEAASEICGT